MRATISELGSESKVDAGKALYLRIYAHRAKDGLLWLDNIRYAHSKSARKFEERVFYNIERDYTIFYSEAEIRAYIKDIVARSANDESEALTCGWYYVADISIRIRRY